MSSEWWTRLHTSPDLADIPIGDFVEGLRDIAELAIPYELLPRRTQTVYSAQIVHWADLATETVGSLLERPRTGIATVRAMVSAAEDAVARAHSNATDDAVDAATAVARILDRLGDRDRAVLQALTCALQPEPRRPLADSLGVHTVWLTRNRLRIEARFTTLLADPAHRNVLDYAKHLGERLGPLVPRPRAESALRDVGLDLSTPAGLALLYVAGPYARQDDDWLENTATDGANAAAAAIDDTFTRDGAPTTTALADALTDLGMPYDVAIVYLQAMTDVRRSGTRWVRWGPSVADKVEAVLHLHAEPATAETIAAAIAEDQPERAVRDALYGDPRFARTTRQQWALRAWGLDEYAGIFGEIGARIDAAGGRIAIRDVLADLHGALPDISESSVRSYINTLAFVTETGTVRRRTEADGWPPPSPLHTARGAFRSRRHELRLALPVTTDLLRGSGQHTVSAVAAALDMTPATRRVFTNPCGNVTVTWRINQPGGPAISSLRSLAAHGGAVLGDTLLLAFDTAADALTVTRIAADEHPVRRLKLLLGRPVRDPRAALAGALECAREDVPDVLRRRGDRDLLELIGHA